jgi:hypothetical protein
LEARRESAGESGAGREDVSESRDARSELLREGDLGSLFGDGLAASSVVVVVVKMEDREGVIAGVVEHRGSAVGGLWELGELADGVEGELDVPPAPAPASSSSGVDRMLELASSRSVWLAMGDSSAPAPFSNGIVWPFTIALGSGLPVSDAWETDAVMPLPLLLLPLVMTSALSLRLLSNVLDVFPAVVTTTEL